ncbi:hypothetical protein [Methylococcus mesophilus]|uniref:hypothetical protein n=1 Tax=Methylococcus mesophilus TaxID=2993564 RepID=UPI00224B1AB5|nr:hypothetical protein [Methylococcus mesophilus]UZR30209.1 hypothetical protein OOT43_06085 [Methylococcus mesophilus]
MQIVISAPVIGANRYHIDGSKGGSVYVLQPAQDDAQNHLGLQVQKFNAPYDLVEQLSQKPLPGHYDLLVDIERGSQDSDKESVLSLAGSGQFEVPALYELFHLDPQAPVSKPHPDSQRPLAGALRGLVVSATRYDMTDDGGGKGGRLYILQPTSGRNPNQFGLELIRLRMPYEIFAQLQALQVPGEYLIDVQLGRGAGDKAQLRVTGLRPDNLLDKARLHELFKLGKDGQPLQPGQAGNVSSSGSGSASGSASVSGSASASAASAKPAPVMAPPGLDPLAAAAKA